LFNGAGITVSDATAQQERKRKNSWGCFSTEISALRALNAAFFLLNSTFASRPGQFIQDFPADRFAGFFPGPGFTLVKVHFVSQTLKYADYA
jgi:hypothetical protein